MQRCLNLFPERHLKCFLRFFSLFFIFFYDLSFVPGFNAHAIKSHKTKVIIIERRIFAIYKKKGPELYNFYCEEGRVQKKERWSCSWPKNNVEEINFLFCEWMIWLTKKNGHSWEMVEKGRSTSIFHIIVVSSSINYCFCSENDLKISPVWCGVWWIIKISSKFLYKSCLLLKSLIVHLLFIKYRF